MQSTLRLARPSAPRAFAQRLSSLPRASALLSTAATSSPARRSLASSTATTPAALLAQHHHRRAFSSSPRPRQAAGGQTMRVVQIEGGVGPSSALHIGEIARPVPKEGEVLVKIRAFGLNRMDLLQREGKYPVPKQAPETLGVEFSGVIADAGSSGGKWQTGQEVFGLAYGGAYAEYIAVSKDMVLAKPAHLSHVEAAGILECFITAYQALFLVGGFKRGESVLVHAGAGGVGVALNQMARAFGAEHVFTTAGSKEKLDVLDRLHFKPTRGICYKDESFADVVKAESKGVDVIVDFIGKDYFAANVDSLRPSGRLVLLGFLSGAKITASLAKVIYNRLEIKGSTLRARELAYQVDLMRRFEIECLPLFTEGGKGGFEVLVHETLAWDQIRDAHDRMASNANVGKYVLTIPE